jgi:hypothetical protein
MTKRSSFVYAVKVLLISGLLTGLMAQAHAGAHRIYLPTGTVIPVRLDDSLSSKTSQKGDIFTTTVRSGPDDAGLPAGTKIEGIVQDVRPFENNQPGYIDVSFRKIIFPDNEAHAIQGSLYNLKAKGLVHTASGRLEAHADKSKDRLKFIGLGAGAGLVIATLTKGNTIENLAVGAGLGYLYNEYLNKPKVGDVNLKSGQEFGVRLDRDFNTDVLQTKPGASGRAASTTHYAGVSYNTTAASAQNIGVMYGDQNVSFGNAQPMINGSTVFVPVSPVARTMGIQYTYDVNHRIFHADNGKIKMIAGTPIYFVNGVRHRMSRAPMLRNGALYAPIDFLQEMTGHKTTWDPITQTVIISSSLN